MIPCQTVDLLMNITDTWTNLPDSTKGWFTNAYRVQGGTQGPDVGQFRVVRGLTKYFRCLVTYSKNIHINVQVLQYQSMFRKFIEGKMRNGSKWYWIKKQIEPFPIHPSVVQLHMESLDWKEHYCSHWMDNVVLERFEYQTIFKHNLFYHAEEPMLPVDLCFVCACRV